MAAQEQEQQAKTSTTSSLQRPLLQLRPQQPQGRRDGERRGDTAGTGDGPGSASSGAGADGDNKQLVLAGAAGDGQQAPAGGKKRGRAAGDKEQNRLKRLLQNHVSAQQARERKKAYMTELEVRPKELELRNAELEQKVTTLQNENNTLRQILKNTTAHAVKKPSGGTKGGGDAAKKHHR